jgi:crotonobetainyl-CoA:carnitine CoA-transferase CaiB-like acyl-CoA transferase
MKPLEQLTILDLSRVLACPFATMILAELGARVIKVEQPGSGDETRGFEPQLAKDSAYYFACNRSKESITVNLRSDEGRQLIRGLAQKADVLVENFPVGTLARHGLDFPSLSSLNPRTGKGSHVDFSMLDGQVSLLTLAAARYFALNEIPPRLGTEHPGRVPSATFRCRDGKYAHVTASDQHWQPLCKALGLSDWGAAYGDNALRVERREEVMQKLTFAVAALDRAELISRLDRADVPVGPVNDVAEILRDPHVRARRLVGSFDYPEVGEFKALAIPYKFLGWDNPEIGRPPALGEHTESVLAELLGLSNQEVMKLRASKAI